MFGWSPYEKSFPKRHPLYTPAKLDRLPALHNTRKGNSAHTIQCLRVSGESLLNDGDERLVDVW